MKVNPVEMWKHFANNAATENARGFTERERIADVEARNVPS